VTATPDRRFERELFARYPGTLALPWIELGHMPTSVEALTPLAAAAGAEALWVKRDDLSGEPYGGNKVRKLEFLLGDAVARGATDVITFGAAGSNHALATAIYGARLGIRVHSMLMPQPNARYVRRNVLAALAVGADLHHFPDRAHALRGAAGLRRQLRDRTGCEPLVIPFGGTTALSSAGFVSAGLELGTQVEFRELPEPDFVYVALGSIGTAAGLALGLRAAGLRTKVVGVPVLSYEMDSEPNLLALIRSTQDLIRAVEPAFPAFDWREGDVEVANGFLGDGYARFTPAGMEAVRLVGAAGVYLEGTYTGKAFSALLSHGRDGRLKGRTVLFWNTYDSRDMAAPNGAADAARVPTRLRDYFEGDVQPLDRDPS
jgi:1-aminocyclopropane-1-carboxylate deaminase/D-cysteine desulfhydrase-like pyridoxal-dependent ACC family enzyme